jgi:uncharacterized protein with PQ loop repeat
MDGNPLKIMPLEKLFGMGMVIGFCFCLIPQIYTTYKTKTVDGLSVHMILLATFGTLCSIGYSSQIGFPIWNILKDVSSLSFSVALLGLYWKYRKPKN